MERSRRAYQTLGLPDLASIDDVKRAYRDLALVHHPDKNMNDPNAADRFKDLSTAYQLLSNPDKKKVYDASLFATTGTAAPTMSSRYEANFHSDLQSARASRPRTSSRAAPPTRSESSYSAEKTEIFRQRAKDREKEMLRRREKEKQEQREKEIIRLKKLQENKLREEERRRRDAEKAKEKLNKILNEGIASPSSTPRVAKPLDDATMRHNERMERLRQEKLRQDEWRRREQEKQLEKKLENLRQKEEDRAQELLSATQNAFQDRISVVESSEQEDRVHCLETEESFERNIIVKGLERVKSAYELSVKQRALSSAEQHSRQQLQVGALMDWMNIELAAREDNGRALLLRDHRFLFSRLSLLFGRGIESINENHRKRTDMMATAVIISGKINQLEFATRNVLFLQHSEMCRRFVLAARVSNERERIISSFLDGANHQLFAKEMHGERRTIEEDERYERHAMRVARDEGLLRSSIVTSEREACSRIFGRAMSALNEQVNATASVMRREHQRHEETARLEKGRLLDEIARLNTQLSSAAVMEDSLRQEAAHATQAAQAAEAVHVPHAAAPVEVPVRMPAVPTACVGVQTLAVASVHPPDTTATAKDSEIEMLRRRLDLFEQAADNRELITLLCNENRRLLETNAKLVEENWKLAQSERHSSSSAIPPSPQTRGKTWKSPHRH